MLLQRVYTLLLLLLLLQSILLDVVEASNRPPIEELMDDQQLVRTLEAEEARSHERALSGNSSHLLEHCSFFNPCEEGYECKDAAAGRRCFPTDCFTNEMEALEAEALEGGTEAGFDGEAYVDMILAKAGVSRETLIEKASLSIKSGEEVAESDNIFNAVIKAIQENPGPLNRIRDIGQKCSAPRSDGATTYQDDSRFEYAGFHVELGLLADASYSRIGIWDEFSEDTWNRLCFGAGPQIMIPQIGLIYGVVTNRGNPDDFTCASMLFDVDILFPIFGLGIAGGFAFNGLTFWEASIGYGLGVGGGISFCYAWNG